MNTFFWPNINFAGFKIFSSLVWIYCFGKNDTELKYNTNISNLLTASTYQYGFFSST